MSQSVYESNRCDSIASSTGQRCRNRTGRGRQCWHHQMRNKNVRVKTSQIPNGGLGLFAGPKGIKKGQRISYTGQAMTHAAVNARYPRETYPHGPDYVYCRSNAHCRDARKTSERGYGRWVNDARGSDLRNNAKLTTGYNVRATRNIAPGSEVLASYGRQYWQ
jgi:hypothetical protein